MDIRHPCSRLPLTSKPKGRERNSMVYLPHYLGFRAADPHSLSRGLSPSCQEISAFFWVRGIFPFGSFDPYDNEWKPAERAKPQPPQECRDRVTLVTGKAEPVAEFVHRNPLLISRHLSHILFQQFRNTRIFSHEITSRVFLIILKRTPASGLNQVHQVFHNSVHGFPRGRIGMPEDIRAPLVTGFHHCRIEGDGP